MSLSALKRGRYPSTLGEEVPLATPDPPKLPYILEGGSPLWIGV